MTLASRLASPAATAVAGPLLAVEKLSVFFGRGADEVAVTRGVTFSISPGERVGIVGESGCGKSVTGLALLGLLPPGRSRVAGSIVFEGRNLVGLPPRELRKIRGRRMSMIFQEPMSALDPVFTVGEQIAEILRTHSSVSSKEARERGVAALAQVGIPLPARRYDEYPHQLSGGMRQRVMIAMAIVCEPSLIVADEPTTALDVTIQAQIIELLSELSARTGTALIFISHDLGVIAETCSRMLTMYAGEIVEDAGVDAVLTRPRHPYTSGLLRSLPLLSRRREKLPSIPGRVPSPYAMPPGCRFRARCGHAAAGCESEQAMLALPDAVTRCWRANDLALPGAFAS